MTIENLNPKAQNVLKMFVLEKQNFLGLLAHEIYFQIHITYKICKL